MVYVPSPWLDLLIKKSIGDLTLGFKSSLLVLGRYTKIINSIFNPFWTRQGVSVDSPLVFQNFLHYLEFLWLLLKIIWLQRYQTTLKHFASATPSGVKVQQLVFSKYWNLWVYHLSYIIWKYILHWFQKEL